MTDGDYQAFAATMADVHTYYGKTISPGVIDIYWNGLRMYDLAAVRDALGRHVKNTDRGAFLPKIADVEAMLRGTTKDEALIAWSKVTKAVREAGAWYSVAFDDGLVHRVIEEMGGWLPLCKTIEKEWPFRENEFVARYRAYRARSESPDHPPRLIGIIEGENRRNGFETKDRDCLKLIGDPKKVLLVMRSGKSELRLGVTSAGEIAEDLLKRPLAIEEKP